MDQKKDEAGPPKAMRIPKEAPPGIEVDNRGEPIPLDERTKDDQKKVGQAIEDAVAETLKPSWRNTNPHMRVIAGESAPRVRNLPGAGALKTLEKPHKRRDAMTTDDVIDDARKTARDAKAAASNTVADMQDDLLAYTQEQPMKALLSAFVIGIVVGKFFL